MALITSGHATAKLTVSVKRRLGNGDEIFIAPGIEISCAPDELDAKQVEVTDRVNAWIETMLEAYPDPTDDADDADDGDDDADDDADDAADDDADDDADDEDGLTEEEVAAMDKKALVALIKEHELEADPKLAIKALRAAVIEELFADDEEGDDDADDDADDDGDDDGDDDAEAGYTEDELKKLKLEELQEICKEWSIGDPKLKKGVDVKAKKLAYVKHVLAAQADAEE